MFKSLTIKAGLNKDGQQEALDSITIRQGEVLSIVGYTGSGKSQLIQDIESMNQGEGITQRQILLDDHTPSLDLIHALHNKMVAHLSQNMRYMLDMTIKDFISMHAACVGKDKSDDIVTEVIKCANELAGEPVNKNSQLIKLSGGQTRALMIANIVVNSSAPIVLIDEIENAGIDKLKAMSMLSNKSKIVLVVTHDPVLALSASRRLVMKNGAMWTLKSRTPHEESIANEIHQMNDYISKVQMDLREGTLISA